MIGFNCYYVVDNLIIVRANLDPLLLSFAFSYNYPARALRALGLLLADGAPTVGRGKTF